jgi:hypothetical protein
VFKRNAAGELNVGDLLSIDKPHPGPAAETTAQAPPGPAPAPPRPDPRKGKNWSPKITTVDVTTISLYRATLKYVDLPTSATTLLGEFDVNCEGSLGSNPIMINQGFLRFHTLNLQVQANVSRDLKSGHFAMQVADLDLMSFKPYFAFLSGFARGYWMLRNLSLRGRINSAIVDVDELSCRPNGGTLKGTAKLWLSQGKPTFIWDAKFEDVGLDTFLWHTRPDGVSFGGALGGTCSVTGRGTTLDDLKAQLIGSADLQVTDGRFQNRVLMQIGRIAKEYLGAQDSDVYRANALGRFIITEGKIHSSDLRFDSNIFDLYMTGPGYVTFDGELRVLKVTVRVGQGKGAAQIPLRIKGYMNEPKVDADWKGLGKSLIGD